MLVFLFQNDLFLEQAGGYVKALEKSTSRGLEFKRGFWTLGSERLGRRKEPESCFEGSVYSPKW